MFMESHISSSTLKPIPNLYLQKLLGRPEFEGLDDWGSAMQWTSLAFKVLAWIWPGELSPGERILIMTYAGTDMARSLSWRQRIVCAAVAHHCRRMAANAID
jgi:hypothetical protein